jgi:hypothetical protein
MKINLTSTQDPLPATGKSRLEFHLGFADVFSALQDILLAADLLAEFHSSIRESIKRLQPISQELKNT